MIGSLRYNHAEFTFQWVLAHVLPQVDFAKCFTRLERSSRLGEVNYLTYERKLDFVLNFVPILGGLMTVCPTAAVLAEKV